MKGRNKKREEGMKEGEKERGRKEGSYKNTVQDLTEDTKLVSRPDILSCHRFRRNQSIFPISYKSHCWLFTDRCYHGEI